MEEIVVNLHMHTRYSDGSGSHLDIALAAIECGLDAVIITDHNVLVGGFESYFNDNSHRVLLLVGEEIHDQDLDPQKNHLLVFGADQEMATFADDPHSLIGSIKDAGGLSFIAHPGDTASQSFNEPAISWEDWTVDDFTGMEVWNGFSELKTIMPTKIHGVFYSLFPFLVAHRPQSETLKKWDDLLVQRRIVAIGGSDAHALHMSLGPMKRVVFPYKFHFQAINTHIFIQKPLTGNVEIDRKMIYAALADGHCFVGYDLPLSTRGFRFYAHAAEIGGIMGDEVAARGGATLEAHLPSFAEIHLIRNGKVLLSEKNTQAVTYFAREPGVYRIEAFRNFMGSKRGWIFSNPIYIR